MIVANQAVVRLFKHTSSRLVVEYHELDAIQEFKLSLGRLESSTSSFPVLGDSDYEENLKALIGEANNNLNKCIDIVTERHERTLLGELESIIFQVDSLAKYMVLSDREGNVELSQALLKKIQSEINTGIEKVDALLAETKLEIDEYESTNQTVIRHGTMTVLSLGLIILLIIFIGGLLFIRSLTIPIKKLVAATVRISEGDKNAKVQIDTKDEFHILAESFNAMLDSLDKTTVSKDYLNNILSNMFSALVVTDSNLNIRSVNNSSIQLLNYSESQLIDQPLGILFENHDNSGIPVENNTDSFINYQSFVNNQKYLKSRSGGLVPVLLSCSIMKNKNNTNEGLIIVAHDLTEKRAIEQKLEKSRKERMVDIYDAQEEERIRIATDLHDGLGQMLTAISYAIQELNPGENKSGEENREAATRIQSQIDLAIKEAKNIAHDLIPIVLKDFGLIVAIKNLIAKANEMYETEFQFNAFDFNERIDSKREKALYRICQETLNNIVKHAKAKNVTYQVFLARLFSSIGC